MFIPEKFLLIRTIAFAELIATPVAVPRGVLTLGTIDRASDVLAVMLVAQYDVRKRNVSVCNVYDQRTIIIQVFRLRRVLYGTDTDCWLGPQPFYAH